MIAGLKAIIGLTFLETQDNLCKAGISVLIIDDDKNITWTFAHILQKQSYQTDSEQTRRHYPESSL